MGGWVVVGGWGGWGGGEVWGGWWERGRKTPIKFSLFLSKLVFSINL